MRRVAWNRRLVDACENTDVLLSPDVPDAPFAQQPRLLHVERDRLLARRLVVEPRRNRSVCKRARPYLPVVAFRDAASALSKRVLVDLDYLVVCQKRQREIVKARKVASDQKRRGDERPHGDVRILLVRGEACRLEVVPANGTYAQHVWVVPRTGASVHEEFLLLLDCR